MTSRFAPLMLGLLVVATAAQCHVGGLFPGASPDADASALPADVQSLGEVRLASAEESVGAISAASALDVAAKNGDTWPDPTAYLVVMTDHSANRSGPAAVSDALIWLIRWDTLEMEFPAPTIGITTVYTHAYVLIDAHSGRVISETFTE